MTAPTDADLQALAAALGKKLRASGHRLVTAESCTGGWIAKVCTDLPGTSHWFLGSAVTYANESKSHLLGVDEDLLRAEGAVSEPVVEAMARGALDRLGGELSVAVSGIAGPGGGTETKPVGTVWFAWGRRAPSGDVEVTTACQRLPGDRESVRRWTVHRALQGLLER